VVSYSGAVKRMAIAFVVALLGIGVTAGGAGAKGGWHRCEVAWTVSNGIHVTKYLGSLCNGRGRVIFPYVSDFSESSGYRAIVTGFLQTGAKSAIADVHGDGYILQGECGQNGVIDNCRDWDIESSVRYATSDGGRHWRPIRFHRHVDKWVGPGPGNPPLVGSVDDDPPLAGCGWSHAKRHVLVDGIEPRFGNWCLPPDVWRVPDSLWP
jgi:hypothetical protein